MKRLLLLILLLPFFAAAQNKPLMVEGTTPDLYLTHIAAPKENYYSIGRLYNISPKVIAPFNNMDLEKGFSIGQSIKIPLTAEFNFLQSGTAAKDEVLIPVYHTVADKEGLFRISVNHNKVPVEALKLWNKITGDAVSNGTNLIIGFLKVKKALSPLAANAVTPAVFNAPKTDNGTVTKTPVENNPPVVGDPHTLPPVKAPVKEPVVITPKSEIPKPVKENQTQSEIVKGTGDNFNGGVFKSLYQAGNAVNENGAAGVFKSTSGWEDGKYYCLHNTARPGTIVKVTNPATGKTIYAKVLDGIPDIKQNAGLVIRISNAAADILGAGENKFDCSLSYSK